MLGILKIAGTIIKLVAKPLVSVANKAPAGTLTGLGTVIGAVGVATGVVTPHIVTSANIVEVLNAAAGIVTALGTVLAAFGAQRAHSA